MKSTREKILRTLLAFPGSTINDLAEAVGINGISIRHHLTALEAEDLVTSSEERHGVGRPRLIYSLTDKGIEKFPTSYLRLIQRIMGSLSEKMSPTELKLLFEEIGAEIAEPYEIGLEGKSLDARIKLIKSALTNEGFIVEVKKYEDHYILTSLSCPYYRVGLDHPVVCTLDHTLISRLMGLPIEIDSCICEGFDHCTYIIPRHHEG
jgi:predicted ArsR family transcriptional regulator